MNEMDAGAKNEVESDVRVTPNDRTLSTGAMNAFQREAAACEQCGKVLLRRKRRGSRRRFCSASCRATSWRKEQKQ